MSKFRSFFKQIKDDPQLQGTVNQVKATGSVVAAYIMLREALDLKEKRKQSKQKSLEAKQMLRIMVSMEKSVKTIEGMMRDKATSAAGAATTTSITDSPIKETATAEVPAADLSADASN